MNVWFLCGALALGMWLSKTPSSAIEEMDDRMVAVTIGFTILLGPISLGANLDEALRDK